MSNSLTTTFKVVATASIAVAIIFGGVFALSTAKTEAALTESQISSILSLLTSFGADANTIANVDASLRGTTPVGGGTTGGTTTGGACFTFTRNHKAGESGGEVMEIQKFLNKWTETRVAATGAGSPGNETSTFGPATKAAVMKFQNMHAADVLTPVGLTAGTGFWGAATRAKANMLNTGCTTTGGGTTGTVPTTGGGVWVAAVGQPSNNLAPQSASRLPFTNFTLTNNTSAAVTINSITVKKTGVADEAVFSGVVLVDSANSVQVGTSKTLNANDEAQVGETFTMMPGETRSFTVAGNMAASLSAYTGQVVGLTVTAVNANGAVTGSLPIMGASHTINSTLTIGSVSTSTSSFDPGAAQAKNLGDTDVRVSGLRFTAGSAEDLRLYSIRWRQVGTASAVDLANVRTFIGDTAYPTTVSADGKYYTSVFPGGLLIAKGNSIDVYNKVDLVGTNSASRTVDFDIDKVTDVYFVGQTYGMGVAPSGTFQPWFTGFVTTINPGTVTTIGKATEVPAQNIAANIPNVVLGGFVTDFKGEPVTVTSLPITIATSTDLGGVITGISIVDSNGVVVAGPKDQASTATNNNTVTFTDSITFPIGRKVWTIKGKMPSGTPNNATVIVSTNPSSWSGVTGQTSGNTITISTGNFAMNTMTVKAAALVASLSTSPSSQNVVAGAQGFLLANLQLDATQSGEDVRISTIPIEITGTTSNLSSCQLFDGATALNTGSNVPSSLSASTVVTNFTMDNTLTVGKGTVKTLGFKCNVATGISGTFIVNIDSSNTWSATGVTSGSSITETFGNLTGGTMTVASGSLVVSVDSSSPSFALGAAGTSGVTLGVLKFRATNETLSLTEVGLQLDNGTYGSTSSGNGGSPGSGTADLVQVYLYDGATLVGTVTFTGTNQSATSTLNTAVTLPKDTDKLLTIKGDLAAIGTSQPGGIGNTIKVDPEGAKTTGVESGTTIYSAGATTGVAGVQLFKSYPTLALDTLPSTGAADGRLMRFKVTANSAGPVGINEFTFTISSTTGVTITTVRLRGYTDASYSQPISGQGTGGQVGSDVATITSGTAFEVEPSSSAVQVPAGTTYYFELTAAVSGMDTGDSNVTTLGGDAAAVTGLTSGFNVGTTTLSTGEVGAVAANFVWSGNSTSTSVVGAARDVDWTNGYSVPGLPSGGLIQTRSN
ncbi:MAG: peptidoglycan-binding protein [Parcubacteria group bacterium]|nr:peptidoglycan-binding protein [Parcubacteria group bacterium]